MSEFIHQFDDEYEDPEGNRYTVRVHGRQREDGDWEGWLEFVPVDGGAALRTDSETEQADREDFEYWASGLTETYFEGALERARDHSAERDQPS
jgi:hypothetical protein